MKNEKKPTNPVDRMLPILDQFDDLLAELRRQAQQLEKGEPDGD